MSKRTAGTNELGVLGDRNIRLARRLANRQLGKIAIERLRDLTKTFGFSLSLGDIQYMDGGWYITHAGLFAYPGAGGVQEFGSSRCVSFVIP